MVAANGYLREHFLPAFNAEFGRAPADPASAFVPAHGVDLEHILCIEDERVVGRDNVVTTERVALQLATQPGRRTCAGLQPRATPAEWRAFGLVRYALPRALRPERPAAGRLTAVNPRGQITMSNS